VWPEALGLAEKAGPDTLFRSLRSVLSSGYGLSHGKRKRKRLGYYQTHLTSQTIGRHSVACRWIL